MFRSPKRLDQQAKGHLNLMLNAKAARRTSSANVHPAC